MSNISNKTGKTLYCSYKIYYNICCILSVPKKARNVTINPAYSVALALKTLVFKLGSHRHEFPGHLQQTQFLIHFHYILLPKPANRNKNKNHSNSCNFGKEC